MTRASETDTDQRQGGFVSLTERFDKHKRAQQAANLQATQPGHSAGAGFVLDGPKPIVLPTGEILSSETAAIYQGLQSMLVEKHQALMLQALTDPDGARGEIRVVLSELLAATMLSSAERTVIRDLILQQVVGMGPELEPYMTNPDVSDIYVVDWETIFVKERGEKILTPTKFKSYDDALHQASRIAEIIGRAVTSDHPLIDTRLPNGARLNIMVRPTTPKGPVITVRKPPALVNPMSVDRLVELGAISPLIRELYQVLAGSRVNVLFAGSVDVGKTTNIRGYAGFFPMLDRIMVIEDTEELRLQSALHPHIFSTEVAPNASMHDLTRAALRQGVDRIMYGEVRTGSEIADLRMTWRSGQSGGAGSIHSRTARAVLERLCEGLEVGESREEVFREVTRDLDFVFFLEAYPATHQRFLTGVYEVRSPEAIAEDGGEPLHPLILWKEDHWAEDKSRVFGVHEVVGRISHETANYLHRYRSADLVQAGVTLPEILRPDGWNP